MSATAHSVVEPSRTTKRVAGAIVILYALVSMMPLVWIFMTSFKSPYVRPLRAGRWLAPARFHPDA